MSILFLSQSQRQAAALLRKAGLSQLPIAATIQLTRETAENWSHQEMEQGNLPLIFQMVKGDRLEKDSQLLFDELKDLVVAKYIVRLQMEYKLAAKAATVLLPFILKRMVELMQKNPQFKMWWDNVDLRRHFPSREGLKTKFRNMGNSWQGNSSENSAFA